MRLKFSISVQVEAKIKPADRHCQVTGVQSAEHLSPKSIKIQRTEGAWWNVRGWHKRCSYEIRGRFEQS
jgi:hypothetical protein